MTERLAVAVAVSLLLLALYVWIQVAVYRHLKRRRQRLLEHPEEWPNRRQLSLRAAPFILLGGAGSVWGWMHGRVDMVVMGMLAVALLAVAIWRYRPPEGQ